MHARTHDKELSTDDLYSRNWAFISPDLQGTLNQTRIFAAGVGLTSTIAVLACRTGFGSFILADGDQVELSNLNRQAFFRRQIGENKAAATADLLREIRPDVDVTVLPAFIEGDSYRAALDQAQLVVNSMDYDNPAIFALARDARARGIPMLVPLDLGWGGAVVIFTAESMPFETFLGIEPDGPLHAAEVSARLVTQVLEAAPDGVPHYLAETLADFQQNGAQWPCEPQLGPAASLTAAMVVRAATALAAGESVLVAPAVFHVDLRALLDPTSRPPAPVQPAATVVPATVAPVPAPVVAEDASVGTGAFARKARKMPLGKKPGDDFQMYLRSRQQRARYPALAALATRGRNLIYQRTRPSGLWVFALRHDQFPADALDEFGEFRIDQCALAGFYDTSKIAQRGDRTDPSLAGMPGNTIHVVSGTSAGQIHSCCSIVPPHGPLYSEPTGRLLKRRLPLLLADDARALFPSETELFGRGVFESLPAIQQIPIERMRELVRMMRNQAINSPLTSLAVFEVCFALTEVLTDPKQGIDLALGNAGPEARNLMAIINIPLLYAPWASVVVSETSPDDDFWVPPPNAEGYFWPFVMPSADLRAITPFRQQLDQALGSPAHSTRNALVQVANLPKNLALPQFVLHAQMPPRWFVSPPYGPPVPLPGRS